MLQNDAELTDLLQRVRTIALVGASPKSHRDSYRVMQFLLACGYRVIPVNPLKAGQVILGQRVVATLEEVEPVPDLVDIFRNSEAAAAVVDDAIRIGAAAVWLQLGVINNPAAEKAQAAGLSVVMDRCPMIDIPRLGLNSV